MKRENVKQAIEQAKILIAQGEALLAMPDDYDWEKVLGYEAVMGKKQLMQDLIKAAYAQAEMPASQKTALDGIFGIGVTSGVVVTLNAWSKDHDSQQAEIDRLKIQLEQIDTVRSGLPCNHVWGTSGYSPALDAPVAAVCMKCGIDGESARNGWMGCNPKMEQNQ